MLYILNRQKKKIKHRQSFPLPSERGAIAAPLGARKCFCVETNGPNTMRLQSASGRARPRFSRRDSHSSSGVCTFFFVFASRLPTNTSRGYGMVPSAPLFSRLFNGELPLCNSTPGKRGQHPRAPTPARCQYFMNVNLMCAKHLPAGTTNSASLSGSPWPHRKYVGVRPS